MNNKFIYSITADLIKQKDYMPLKDSEDNLTIRDGLNILAKNSPGGFTVVELINGDLMSNEDISVRLEANKERFLAMEVALACSFLEVFIFSAQPDIGKLEAITNGQTEDPRSRKQQSCISVNLAEKTMKKHSKTNTIEAGLVKIIERQLTMNSSTSVEYEDIRELLNRKQRELEFTFISKTSILTYGLIAFNILIFVLLSIYSIKSGKSYNSLIIEYGAKENMRILSGEYWRFITPIFLHANITHLLVNCYSLYVVGVRVEKIFGHARFIVIYLIAGFTGNLLSFMFSMNPGVGASGAIFGLLGTIVYFGLERPALFKRYFGHNVITMIVINLAYGFSREGIDNFAHIGGLAGGFLASGSISIKEKSRWFLNRYLYVGLTILLVCSGLFYGFNSKENKALIGLNEIYRLEKEGNWSEIERTGEKLEREGIKNTRINFEVLWMLIRAEAELGKYDKAIEHAGLIKVIDPLRGHYISGLLYLEIRDYSRAKEELLEVVKIDPDFANVQDILKEIDKTKENSTSSGS